MRRRHAAARRLCACADSRATRHALPSARYEAIYRPARLPMSDRCRASRREADERHARNAARAVTMRREPMPPMRR